MATRTSVVGTGLLWSATSTWADATVPLDGDFVVIAAQSSVLMDVDQSAFTGLSRVTITGHATSPGMLYFCDGTSGVLKIRTTGYIIGTSAAQYGRLLANSDGVWGNADNLSSSYSAKIILQGTAYFSALYLHIRLYCHQPSVKYVRCYGTKVAISSVDVGNNWMDTAVPHGFLNKAAVSFKGSDLPSPLREGSVYFVDTTLGASRIRLRYYAGIASVVDGTFIPLSSTGSGLIEIYNGIDAGATTVGVLEDVSSDPDWTTLSGKNEVEVCNLNGRDYQTMNMSSIAADSIQLGTSLSTAKYPGSVMVLAQRNVCVEFNTTSQYQYAFRFYYNPLSSSVLQCEITNRTGTVAYGVAMQEIVGSVEMPGIIHGMGIGFRYTSNISFSGVFANVTTCLLACSEMNLSGMVLGCSSLSSTGCFSLHIEDFLSIGSYNLIISSYGVYCKNMTIRGGIQSICRSSHGITFENVDSNISPLCYQSGGIIVKGGIFEGGMAAFIYGGSPVSFHGDTTICGCRYVMMGGSVWFHGTTIRDCANLSVEGRLTAYDLTASRISAGIIDTQGRFFRNVEITPASPIAIYQHYSDNHNFSTQFFNPTGRHIQAWNSGGRIATEAYDLGTHGVTPTTTDIVYKNTFEADYSNGIDLRLTARRGSPLTVHVHIKKSTATMTVSPYAELCDPSYGFGNAGEQLAIAVSDDHTDWQTIAVSFTPSYDRSIALRIAGKNPSGSFYWYWELLNSSSWGNIMLR